MKAKEFSEVNIRIAEHQEEYQTLPAFYNSAEGSLTVCFELDSDELNRMKATNELWLKIYTFGQPLQPLHPSCNKEALIVPPSNITVILGRQGTGKTQVLKEIAKQSKGRAKWVDEKDCGLLLMPAGDTFDHILIDGAVGAFAMIGFAKRWGRTHKVTIATQNPQIIEMLGHCNVYTLTDELKTKP